MFDLMLEQKIPQFQYFIGKMVYWKNDGINYRGLIRQIIFEKQEVYIVVERFLYKTMHKLKYSDFLSVWALHLCDIRKVVDPKVQYDLFNYEIIEDEKELM